MSIPKQNRTADRLACGLCAEQGIFDGILNPIDPIFDPVFDPVFEPIEFCTAGKNKNGGKNKKRRYDDFFSVMGNAPFAVVLCLIKSKILTIRYEYAIILTVIVMERRMVKLIVDKAGGTAGKDSKTYKVSLPSKWIAELGLADSETEIAFDGERIIISPHLSVDQFSENKKSLGHRLMKLAFYDGEVLCSKIVADLTDKTLSVQNTTEHIIKTAFGNNKVPTWEDFQNFLEERCVPRSRSGIREYLETIGTEEYNPIEIIKKTSGRMAEDNQWIQLEEIQ